MHSILAYIPRILELLMEVHHKLQDFHQRNKSYVILFLFRNDVEDNWKEVLLEILSGIISK